MESPRRYGDNKMQIMAAFQRPLPGNVIEPLYAYGISEIAQAFWMTQELGTVYQNEQPRPGLGWMSMHRMRGDCPQWKSLLETETANIRREGTDVRDAIVDVNAVRQQETHIVPYSLEEIRRHHRSSLPLQLEDSEEVEVYTDGSTGGHAFEPTYGLRQVDSQKMLEIKADSRAAIGALRALQRRDPTIAMVRSVLQLAYRKFLASELPHLRPTSKFLVICNSSSKSIVMLANDSPTINK
ncbi:hypothetical protein EV178_001103 [Coemansia sp. RSA 1646]|nr:hypothetical protein EV178_001103 [Coemansia sp. RSA 1646]